MLLIASIAGISFDGEAPLRALGWFAAMLTIYFFRYRLSQTYRTLDDKAGDDARLYLKRSLVGGALSGLGFALVPPLFLDAKIDQAIPLIFILMGITSGAVVHCAAYKPLSMIINIPIVLATAIKMLGMDNTYHVMMSFDILLYLLFLWGTASRLEQAFIARVNITAKAFQLAASVKSEHAATQAAVASLYQLANYDSLTSLSNRAAFSRQLNSWLDDAAKAQTRFLLILVDIDHFKSVNDTLGHRAGDSVLAEVARRLSGAFSGTHLAARLGGDEFAVICPISSDDARGRVKATAEMLVAAVNGPFFLEERTINICISLGVAAYPEDGASTADLLANADLALYAAKRSERDSWRQVDFSLLEAAKMTRRLDNDLPIALNHGELEVWYQPQITTATGRLSGLEALIRWNHPVHGWITPPQIVAAAWRMRIPEQLTGFVLDQACQKLRDLAEAGFEKVGVAMNISPRELDQYDLPDLVRRCIATHGIDPGLLELEITEETLADSPAAIAALTVLASMGVRLAIDDFSMGYTSLAYLRTMRVNRIKIDRSFVTGFADRPDDQILVQAILGIGRSFKIDVVAEGVETAEEAILLRAFGCQVVQGFFFGHPMRDDALDRWMAENARLDSAKPRGHEASAARPALAISATF
ncbi:MAG: EAL domain-containing protein [Beijerinckiaceae bacterium]|nr:EAL domain-containing protein [Beijerinckiaceae bacterium]